jgi:hypothetical protein
MKRLVWLCTILSIVLFTTTAIADYRVTATWTPNTDTAADHYELLLDGVGVVPDIPIGDGTANFLVPDITGQSVVLRTWGNTGAPTDYLDTNPIVLIKMQQPTNGFSLQIVWE